MSDFVKCDVCGKPATNAARDFAETTKPWGVYRTFKPFGLVKYGCDEHRATSNRISLMTMYPTEGECSES